MDTCPWPQPSWEGTDLAVLSSRPGSASAERRRLPASGVSPSLLVRSVKLCLPRGV